MVPWITLGVVLTGMYGISRIPIGGVSIRSWQQAKWGWDFGSPVLQGAAVLILLLVHRTRFQNLALTWGHWTAALVGIPCGIVILFGGVIVSTNFRAQKRPLIYFPGWSTLIFQGIAVPIAEELFWRGYFQSQVGLWLTALLFGLLHGVRRMPVASRVGAVLYAGVLGLLFGYLRWSTGGIIALMLLHGFLNVLNHVTTRRSGRVATSQDTTESVSF